MRLVVACCSLSTALALSACSSPPTVTPSLAVGGGIGSQYGNYGEQTAGEMRDSAGDRCIIFDWDRPLTKNLAVRFRSASCKSREHPDWMVSKEISRTVIPMSHSDLKDGQGQAGQ